jgi:hypothetical protein
MSDLKPLQDWYESDGPCLWWKFPVEEPPYVGSPLDEDFPEYLTHFTAIPVPKDPMHVLQVNPSAKPYRQGLLTETLNTILTQDLAGLLRDNSVVWKDLLINYESPMVRRLWTEYQGYRLYLHQILPCSVPYRHIHPWPSAIHVVSGVYEMEVGTLDTLQTEVPPEAVPAATLQLGKGSTYEMVNPKGWHSVRPLGEASLSVMLTGSPWFTENPFKGKGQGENLHPAFRDQILESFREAFPVTL